MRAFFYSLLGYFLTPWGIVLMGALDSSLVFFLPLGIDFAVIILAARKPELFWLYALLATVGSVIGAMVTFWIGRKVGEHGLTRLMKPSRLERVKHRVSRSRRNERRRAGDHPAALSLHRVRPGQRRVRRSTRGRSSPRWRECASCAFSPREDWPPSTDDGS